MQINEYLQSNFSTVMNEVMQPASVGTTGDNQSFSSVLNELESLKTNSATAQQIPSWVDPDYGYDPLNPRKPNLKEMMSIVDAQIKSGVEEKKYLNSSSNIIAADILYGVVGSGEDTRDWQKIMESENILAATHQETAIMHEPKLEIVSKFNADMVLIDQKAAVKNKVKDTLMVLGGSALQVKEKLFNFGITNDDIPDNIAEQITFENFEAETIAGIQDYRSQLLDTNGEENSEVNVLMYLSTGPENRLNTDLFLGSDDGSS